MVDQQRNPTEPEHSGVEMTSSEQPTKQVISPERTDGPSNSSQVSNREQIGHRIARYISPIRDALHDIDVRSGNNRSSAASTSGQSITPAASASDRIITQLPQPSHGIGIRAIYRSPAASATVKSNTQLPQPSHGIHKSGMYRFAASSSGQGITSLLQHSLGIYKRSGIYRSPAERASRQIISQSSQTSHGTYLRRRVNRFSAAGSSGQNNTQVPEVSRKRTNFNTELASADIYPLRLERKNISKILKSTRTSRRDTETVVEVGRPEDNRTPSELDTDDENYFDILLSFIFITCFLSFFVILLISKLF